MTTNKCTACNQPTVAETRTCYCARCAELIDRRMSELEDGASRVGCLENMITEAATAAALWASDNYGDGFDAPIADLIGRLEPYLPITFHHSRDRPAAIQSSDLSKDELSAFRASFVDMAGAIAEMNQSIIRLTQQVTRLHKDKLT